MLAHLQLALLSLCTGQGPTVLSPAYMGDAGPGPQHCDVLATLVTAGLANREHPALWLNSSSKGWVGGFPAVMWPYPQADKTWVPYLEKTKGVQFEVASDAELCTLLSHTPIRRAVKGVVMYEESATLNALKWAAVSAAGQHDGIPATRAMLAKHACLAHLPVLFTIPPAATFADDLAVYAWMAETLLPTASTKVLVGACEGWANYSCSAPLGMAAVDYAVAMRSIVVNLSPDAAKHPEQHAMFAKFAAHLEPLGIFSGWATPESMMVTLLSKKDGVVVMGAPNLSFLRSLKVSTTKLPHHRAKATLDKTKIYLTIQSNEGDTPKNAYSFRGGNFLLERSVPISWGSAPIIAELFPGLWEYYALNAKDTDQFFSATGGAGYAYPWSLPNPQAYFKKAALLNKAHMPAGEDSWVDVWDGGCPSNTAGVPASDAHLNPCMPMYGMFEKAAGIGGFSQWCSNCNGTNSSVSPHYVFNDWQDGTPVFLQPYSLWYPGDKKFCNKTGGGRGVRPSAASLAAEADCIERILRAVAEENTQRPLFVPAYGVENYVDMAHAMQARLGAEFVIVGTQDFAALGREAAPSAG